MEGMKNNVASVLTVLRSAGIIFLDGDYSGNGGPGVRLAKPSGNSIDATIGGAAQYKE